MALIIQHICCVYFNFYNREITMEKDFERVNYSLNYYVTRSDSHACQGCGANLDLYGEVVDRCEDDEWVVRKCGHCGCLSLIDLPKYEGS
jgi:hypothetical protein